MGNLFGGIWNFFSGLFGGLFGGKSSATSNPAQTATAIMNLLTSFGVMKNPLSADQMTQLTSLLSGGQVNPTQIMSLLQSFGVLNSSSLNAQQISSIISILELAGVFAA